MLDNFETNLKPQAEPGTTAEPLWACQDPAWDRCLARLAEELVVMRSRVLITCRRPLVALAGRGVGNDTMLAVQNYQRKIGMEPADGYAGVGLLARLRQGS